MKAHTRKRAAVRTARERDLIELLEFSHERERKVSDALVAVLTSGNVRVLEAIGVLVGFVARARRNTKGGSRG